MNTPTTESYDALIALVRTLRAEWSVDQLRDAIRKTLDVADEPPAFVDLTIALLRCALDASVRTPGVLALYDHHWQYDTSGSANQQRRVRAVQRASNLRATMDADYPATDVAAALDRARTLRPDDGPDSIVVYRTALMELRDGFTADQAEVTDHGPVDVEAR